MDFVDDDGLYVAEGLPRFGGQHEVEGFRGGDEDIRRAGNEFAALVDGGVASADPYCDLRGGVGVQNGVVCGDVGCGAVVSGLGEVFGGLGDSDEGRAEVAFNVGSERFERGDVEDPGAFLFAPALLGFFL